MMSNDPAFRIAVVEDQQVTRRALTQWIGRQPDYEIVGSSPTAEEAIAGLAEWKPDAVLLDLGLPGMHGIEAIRRIKEARPETEVMVLTIFDTDETVFQSIQAGATGYLLKDSTPEEILAALDLLLRQKGAPMSPSIARRVIRDFQQPGGPEQVESALTAREREILDLLARGYAYKEVADRLGIAFGTVQTHIKNLYQKLQVNSKVGAVTKALGLAKRHL